MRTKMTTARDHRADSVRPIGIELVSSSGKRQLHRGLQRVVARQNACLQTHLFHASLCRAFSFARCSASRAVSALSPLRALEAGPSGPIKSSCEIKSSVPNTIVCQILRSRGQVRVFWRSTSAVNTALRLISRFTLPKRWQLGPPRRQSPPAIADRGALGHV